MTTFSKTIKNYINQIINSESIHRELNEFTLQFEKTCLKKSRGDMHFSVTPKHVYVTKQMTKSQSDYKVIINKHISEMTKEDWKIFYKEANKMNRRTKIKDFRYRTWLTDFIF